MTKLIRSCLILVSIGLIAACTDTDNANTEAANDATSVNDTGTADNIESGQDVNEEPSVSSDGSYNVNPTGEGESAADVTDNVESGQDTNENQTAAAKNMQAEGKTADQQNNKDSDYKLTQKIRQQIVEDESLSTNAHNVKIITENGKVTLKGVVDSAAEKTKVEQHARAAAGSAPLENQIEITQ